MSDVIIGHGFGDEPAESVYDGIDTSDLPRAREVLNAVLIDITSDGEIGE